MVPWSWTTTARDSSRRACATAMPCTSAISTRPGRGSRCSGSTKTKRRPSRSTRRGSRLYDARTGQIVWSLLPGGDVGRGLAADIDPRHRGDEFWTNAPVGVLDARGARIADAPQSVNFAVWWDADPLRELLDGNWIGKWDWMSSAMVRLLTATGASANNGTKATPALSADILGDWREEVDLACRRQRIAADLYDDDSCREPHLHADARPAVPRGDRVAERRLQPASASRILPRRRHETAAPSAHQCSRAAEVTESRRPTPRSARRPRPCDVVDRALLPHP